MHVFDRRWNCWIVFVAFERKYGWFIGIFVHIQCNFCTVLYVIHLIWRAATLNQRKFRVTVDLSSIPRVYWDMCLGQLTLAIPLWVGKMSTWDGHATASKEMLKSRPCYQVC